MGLCVLIWDGLAQPQRRPAGARVRHNCSSRPINIGRCGGCLDWERRAPFESWRSASGVAAARLSRAGKARCAHVEEDTVAQLAFAYEMSRRGGSECGARRHARRQETTPNLRGAGNLSPSDDVKLKDHTVASPRCVHDAKGIIVEAYEA